MKGFAGSRRTAVITVLAAFLLPAIGIGVANAIELGETVMLKVPDMSEFPEPIEEHQFTCRGVTDNAVWLVQDSCSVDGAGLGVLDTVVWNNLIDQAELDILMGDFEGSGVDVWETVTAGFGGVPVDTDGDPKVWIILATIRDVYNSDPVDRNVMFWVNPDDVNGSGLFNDHDCFYINIHSMTTTPASLLAAKALRRIDIPNGLGMLIRTILAPTEELWLVRGLGEIAQYLCYGVTVAAPGNQGSEYNMNEFEKTPYAALTNYQATSHKFDYAAARGQEFLWFMYLRQRFGDDIISDIAQQSDSLYLGMDNIAMAIDPVDPDIQADIVPIYFDWLVCNLYSSLRSTFAGGIYTYDFLEGSTFQFAHVGNSAAFTGKFTTYPIGIWIPTEAQGLTAPIWAAQYDYFWGDYSANTSVSFNGMFSDGSGSGSAINGAWEGILVTIDSTTMDLASVELITLDDFYNGTFTLANNSSYLIVTNNNEGGATDLRYVLAQDINGTPSVMLTMHQGLVSEQYVTLFTALYDVATMRTEGFDWVGPIFTAAIGDSTSNLAMTAFSSDIWQLRFSAWENGTYDLTVAGYDSAGTITSVSRELAVDHVVGELDLGLEITGVRLDVPGGAAAPGSMITLAESDLLGLAVAAQAPVSACRGELTGVIAGPVTVTPVQATLSFEAENGQAAIYRYSNSGWQQLDSYYSGGYISAQVNQGGVYVLGNGPGVSSPEVPSQFQLGGSFPNPFYAETMISFALPLTGHVNLRVYDMSGRLVRTLVDGDMSAANHAITWDGRDHNGDQVGAGVYFCRLEAAGQIQTQKMLRVE
jgi:hypothetical protein